MKQYHYLTLSIFSILVISACEAWFRDFESFAYSKTTSENLFFLSVGLLYADTQEERIIGLKSYKKVALESRRERPAEAWEWLHDKNTKKLCQQSDSTHSCFDKTLKASEIELSLTFKKVISKVGSLIPFESRTPIKVEITNAQEAWIKHRNKKCTLETELNGISSRPIRGSTLTALYKGCLTRMNYEQINYLADFQKVLKK